MKTTPFRGRVIAAIVAALGCHCLPGASLGDLVVDLPEVVVYSDGVHPTNGSFEVLLTLTGDDLTAPPDLSSFNLQFSVLSADVAFGNATAPTSPPLLSGGTLSNFSFDIQTIKAGYDLFSATTTFGTAFDGAALIEVPFTVDAGATGTYLLEFGSLNEFATPDAAGVPTTYLGGSITVAAVPEVAPWMAFGLLATVLAVSSLLRRKPQPRPNPCAH